MKVLFILITLITFLLFLIEALIHFTIGKNCGMVEKPQKHNYIRLFDTITIHIPDKKEFFHIFITVLIFSSISGLISSYFIKYHIED